MTVHVSLVPPSVGLPFSAASVPDPVTSTSTIKPLLFQKYRWFAAAAGKWVLSHTPVKDKSPLLEESCDASALLLPAPLALGDRALVPLISPMHVLGD